MNSSPPFPSSPAGYLHVAQSDIFTLSLKMGMDKIILKIVDKCRFPQRIHRWYFWKRANNLFSVTSLLEGFVHLLVPPSLADCCCCCKAYLFLCVDTPISYRQCFHPTAQNIQYTSYIYNEHYTTDTPNFIIISRILIIVAYAMHSMHCHCSHGHCILTLIAMNLWSFWKIGDAIWIQCHTSWSLHLMSQFWKGSAYWHPLGGWQ